MMFNFKPGRKQCPFTMTATSQGGIVLSEHQCALPVDHDGFHRSKEGVIWDTAHKMYREPLKENRPIIFLGRK